MRDGHTSRRVDAGQSTCGHRRRACTAHHIAEAVQQLRGDADERQTPGAEVALSTGQPGLVAGTMSALILRRGDK